MPSITIRNIPDDVFRKLKSRAGRYKRSLNNEIISFLESAVETKKISSEELIDKVRRVREGINYKISTREINKLKNNGRP